VFVGLELTLVKFWTSASLSFGDQDRDVELDSFIIYPGLALLFEI
jgi:hypothetical protein